MRWQSEAEQALKNKGYDLVDSDGVSDYQGWGVLLGRCGNSWAILNWSYGSCSGCDRYEGMNENDIVESLTDNIEEYSSEEDARKAFNDNKGW